MNNIQKQYKIGTKEKIGEEEVLLRYPDDENEKKRKFTYIHKYVSIHIRMIKMNKCLSTYI